MSNWIEGFDVSHWQGNDIVPIVLDKRPEMQFVVIKATEGVTYVDPCVLDNAETADELGLVYGLYHYARAENNSPEAEAIHFVDIVGAVTANTNTKPFLVLDWEGDSIIKGEAWAASFVKKTKELTGCTPMVYCSASVVPKIASLKDLDCGIWIANRTGKIPNPSPWDVVTMWQYTATPLDYDRFNGTVEQLKKYCMESVWSDYDNDPGALGGNNQCGCHCCD